MTTSTRCSPMPTCSTRDTRDFIQQHNPGALNDILERLLEAQQRGLWQNPGEYREALENLLLDSEEGA
jgi:cobaltochelatase CobN